MAKHGRRSKKSKKKSRKSKSHTRRLHGAASHAHRSKRFHDQWLNSLILTGMKHTGRRKSKKRSAAAKRKWKKSGLYRWMKAHGRLGKKHRRK